MSDKPVIFISYSHRDQPWLDYVRPFFGSLAKRDVVAVWDDARLQIGDDWKGDINSALDACQVFILLVSRHSLASNFIIDVEVARILERRKTEDVRFCPIVVTPCDMDGIDRLDVVNRRPKDRKSLLELTEADRDLAMTQIVREIAGYVSTLAAKRGVSLPPLPVAPSAPVAVAPPAVVDISGLPLTPYEKLVGRDNELKALSDAWADNKTNIISMIAWGGAGKTALINEWLKRLQADNYRGAAVVLGWSFYSQGTKERAASAEGFLDWALGKLSITVDAPSATLKGERLAEALAKRRVLLVLDGVEPLQHGPGAQEGQLKDQGLRIFLRRFAPMPPGSAHGLIVITSRLAIRDIENWKGNADNPGPAPVVDLGRLSKEAGAELLRVNGVTKPEKGLAQLLGEATEHFEGHALALSLLASFLTRRHQGDIRQRNRVGPLLTKSDARGHDHARRVMLAYETDWLNNDPVKQSILYLIGLFDRPASVESLVALRSKPVIEGLTESLAGLTSGDWADAVAALREVRLLDPEDENSFGTVDAHPLVREWFGERLKEKNEKAWREGHSRLYEHLRDTTKEGKTPTLEDLAPLYQAIAHGCRAGRHQEALYEIFVDRTYRRYPSGSFEAYAKKKLGAVGADLAAISWFFDTPYESPIATLNEAARAWVLAEAAFDLRAHGRFVEALPAELAALRMTEEREDWINSATGASNISQSELLIGEIAAAVRTAEKSVAHGHRSGNDYHTVSAITGLADALHAAGAREKAKRLFVDAERRQKKWQPAYPILYSLWGYRYCDFLLAKGDYNSARSRATRVTQWGGQQFSLLTRALDILTIGRAQLGLALIRAKRKRSSAADRNDVSITYVQADKALEALRGAARAQYIPSGLLARAAFRRSVGDWDGAARDLDEVEEIAEPGPMRLYLCDLALERARLALAQVEAFAPLNGMLEKDNPPKPEVPSAQEIDRLTAEAEKQIKIADDYIQKCGYHRRDEELAELKGVLAGKKTFASLPPRV